MDTRAQSIGLGRYFLVLAVGAIASWVVGMFATKLLPGAKSAGSSSYATQGSTWLQQGTDLIPVFVVLTALFMMVVLAVHQRGAVR